MVGTYLIKPDVNEDAGIWEGPTVTVRHGRARFTIPTRFTHGMSLSIRAPWATFGPAGSPFTGMPLVVMSGSPDVTVPYSVGPLRQRFCWAGTTMSRATLRIKVIAEKLPNAQDIASGKPLGTALYPLAFLASLPRPKPFSTQTQENAWCLPNSSNVG